LALSGSKRKKISKKERERTSSEPHKTLDVTEWRAELNELQVFLNPYPLREKDRQESTEAHAVIFS